MITAAKLERWAKLRHHGDHDRLDESVDGLTFDDCMAMNELATRVRLSDAQMTSAEFAEETTAQLRAACENDAVMTRFKELVLKVRRD